MPSEPFGHSLDLVVLCFRLRSLRPSQPSIDSVPMGSGPEPTPEPRRIPPPAPYFPPKREPQPLTPEQIKAADKRARKAKRLAKESNDGTK